MPEGRARTRRLRSDRSQPEWSRSAPQRFGPLPTTGGWRDLDSQIGCRLTLPNPAHHFRRPGKHCEQSAARPCAAVRAQETPERPLKYPGYRGPLLPDPNTSHCLDHIPRSWRRSRGPLEPPLEPIPGAGEPLATAAFGHNRRVRMPHLPAALSVIRTSRSRSVRTGAEQASLPMARLMQRLLVNPRAAMRRREKR